MNNDARTIFTCVGCGEEVEVRHPPLDRPEQPEGWKRISVELGGYVDGQRVDGFAHPDHLAMGLRRIADAQDVLGSEDRT